MHKLQSFCRKVKNHFFPAQKTAFEKTVELWNEDHGDTALRLTYPLKSESIVWDVGGYEGQWASDLFSKYQPVIHVFEPVSSFAKEIADRFLYNKKITVHPYGLSDQEITLPITVTNDRSSMYIEGTETEEVPLRKGSEVFRELLTDRIALMKINIEGGEYALLEDLIVSGIIDRIDNIQVQFHSFVPNATERMEAIQRKLRETHTQTYTYPFVWENWQKKS